jgi:hypothetical protein
MENPVDSSAVPFARLECANAGLGEGYGVQAQRKDSGSQADNQNSLPSHDFLNLPSSTVPFMEYRYCAEMHNRGISARNARAGNNHDFRLAQRKIGESSAP